ncbi:MAG: ATP-binding protein, partial [Rhizobacter sp.]
RSVAERNARGKLVGLLGITIDQSTHTAERQRVQALLRRIELVADAAGLGIWSVDDADGSVEWNAQMFHIYGIGPEQLPPTLDAWRIALVHPDDHEALVLARRRSRDMGENGLETEFRIVRPDGSVRWVTSRSRREEHDGRKMLIGIHLDITELITQRQRAEQALRASRAKSDFLSRASHELRTPLNAVLGFAQLIEHDGLSAPPALQLQRAVRIRSAGEHLLALVDDVLDLAAIEAGSLPVEMTPVSIDDVLADVAQWLLSQAQRSGVAIDVRPCGGWVRADARRLRQIVTNLLSNAIKFNHRGGTVWLSAHRPDQASTWEIAVRDNGRGLSLAQQAHLFEAFHRLGAEREGIEGVGLGLAIVHQLTELMGGSIEAASAPGQGSEFRVSLPAVDLAQRFPATAEPALERAPVVGAAVAARSTLQVLYIEDNSVNVVLVESLVALRAGVDLRCAIDGLSGVELAIAQPPHVALIDMQLPDIDGFEVLRLLRKEPALDDTRMVALSANGLTEDIERALAAGFDDYWTKPIDLKQFLARLDELIAEVSV